MPSTKVILPIIVVAQFFCTSLWFASNAVASDIILAFDLPDDLAGHLTSIVQFGFISGTLCFAVLTIADRYSPSIVFFFSAVLGALFNMALVFKGHTLMSLLVMRFLTGFFLAGIYPVGMKIASDYFEKGLGRSLGFLVGALVLGTAFPHAVKNFSAQLSWQVVVYITSALAILGGLSIYFLVPDGPGRKAGGALNVYDFVKVFRIPDFRASAFGYFGHMWELYAFWTFVPLMLKGFGIVEGSISLWSFLIIASGSLACVLAAYLSERFGLKKMASTALLLSFTCCLLAPLLMKQGNTALFLIFMLFWGMVVIADSPLFSTLVAKNAIPELRGSALTIVNCIGFAITIISIQALNYLLGWSQSALSYTILGVGPFLGLIVLLRRKI